MQAAATIVHINQVQEKSGVGRAPGLNIDFRRGKIHTSMLEVGAWRQVWFEPFILLHGRAAPVHGFWLTSDCQSPRNNSPGGGRVISSASR